MFNNKYLDSITQKYTAFKNFKSLLNAKGGYRPAISMSLHPDLKKLADAYDECQGERGDSRRSVRTV